MPQAAQTDIRSITTTLLGPLLAGSVLQTGKLRPGSLPRASLTFEQLSLRSVKRQGRGSRRGNVRGARFATREPPPEAGFPGLEQSPFGALEQVTCFWGLGFPALAGF